ncbi:MAG TPA: sugar phosphate isomerase/epimerase [Anaerolineae bacterium]|nr:sugar phosphate isomerase/epimerase [Anaerolineae bacterium]
MDRILLGTFQRDITRHYELAQEHHVGLELQVYGYDTDLLDSGEWRSLLNQHKALLRDFEGDLAIHGAFIDMSPASPDKRIVAVTRDRFMLNLDIAAELGARVAVFHTLFLPQVYRPVIGKRGYLSDWTDGQIRFWSSMVAYAAERNVIIALENMWEPEPDIVGNVLETVNSPYLGACLDVGHFYLFSDYLPLERWINRISHRLVHCHLNNHRGSFDEHLPLDFPGGVIDYKRDVLPLLRALPTNPTMTLEMDEIEYLKSSLAYLGI